MLSKHIDAFRHLLLEAAKAPLIDHGLSRRRSRDRAGAGGTPRRDRSCGSLPATRHVRVVVEEKDAALGDASRQLERCCVEDREIDVAGDPNRPRVGHVDPPPGRHIHIGLLGGAPFRPAAEREGELCPGIRTSASRLLHRRCHRTWISQRRPGARASARSMVRSGA